MTVEHFKDALTEFLPKQIEYNLYLYEQFGKILYPKEWNSIKEFHTHHKKYWKDIYSILIVLERFTFTEQLNIIDFMFNFVRNKIFYEKKNN